MSQLNFRKLSRKVLFAYTISDFGKGAFSLLNTYFLLYFYTDVMKIPASATTIILLIARIWDAVNDPMMGVICDRTRSKLGKSRFWLKYFSVPAGVCVALTFCVPDLATSGRIAWVAVTYLLQGMATTVVGIPGSSLSARLTYDRNERVRLSQWMCISSSAATFVIPSMTMPAVRTLGQGNLEVGFTIVGIIVGIVYAACTILVFRVTKGYDPDNTGEALEAEEKTPVFKLLKDGLTNKYAILVSVVYCCYLLLGGIMGSTMVYYFTYNLNNENLMSVYSTMAVIGSLTAIFIMRPLAKKFGNAKTCFMSCIVCLIGFVPRIVTGDRITWVFAVSMVILGAGSALASYMVYQCILDATTWGKLKQGADNQSVVMAIYSFAQKSGTALSTVIASGLLAVFNYEEGAEPTAAVLKLFYAENITIPMGLAVIMALLLLFIARLEKQMAKDLAEKKAEQESQA